jgi:hypothetical protein
MTAEMSTHAATIGRSAARSAAWAAALTSFLRAAALHLAKSAQ